MPKLSKKQRKTAEFRQKKKSGEEIVKKKKEEPVKEQVEAKKGKSKRYILFVGNLPYDATEEDLKEHFAAAEPNLVRPRKDKGFAFIEFEGNEAVRRMNVALRLHHSTFKYRKINVELTAGGGGNTERRRQKVRQRNEKFREELNEKLKEERKAAEKKGNDKNAGNDDDGVHPSRRKHLS
ncbi:nucleolar protein 6 [Trichomonascus vanleenenianus]|uniref:RNA-binding protein n=1 Tax=Trichomonascus vanleenenianus TaxID=2268995 RepID=UPI003ECB0D67